MASRGAVSAFTGGLKDKLQSHSACCGFNHMVLTSPMDIMANRAGTSKRFTGGPFRVCDMDRMKIEALDYYAIFGIFSETGLRTRNLRLYERCLMALETRCVSVGFIRITFNIFAIGADGVIVF